MYIYIYIYIYEEQSQHCSAVLCVQNFWRKAHGKLRRLRTGHDRYYYYYYYELLLITMIITITTNHNINNDNDNKARIHKADPVLLAEVDLAGADGAPGDPELPPVTDACICERLPGALPH